MVGGGEVSESKRRLKEFQRRTDIYDSVVAKSFRNAKRLKQIFY